MGLETRNLQPEKIVTNPTVTKLTASDFSNNETAGSKTHETFITNKENLQYFNSFTDLNRRLKPYESTWFTTQKQV